MSPISNFGVLAFASAVLAVPHNHEQHRHLHARQAIGSLTNAVPTAVPTSVPNVPSVGGSSGGFSGKRGVIYNDASLTEPFVGSNLFGWGANWVSNSAGLSNQVSYIPTLHSSDSQYTSVWNSDAQKAIDAGAKYLFGFNEPDIASQANMDPSTAAAAWKQYMEPFKDKATLVAPAVSNSQNPGEGLDWLKSFMEACDGCSIGAVNQHWYDTSGNDMSLFQQQINDAHSQSGLPVFVGEFGFIGSDSDISEALEQSMGWLDAQDSVLGYAYFMVADGYLNDGSSPSPYGQTYLSS